MTTDELKYPVLMLSENRPFVFHVSHTQEGLLRATVLAVKHQSLVGSTLVDISGCTYQILSVSRVLKGGIADALDSLLNNMVELEFRLTDECVPITPLELGDRVRDCFSDKIFAEVYDDYGLTQEVLDRFLRQTTSVEEIIRFLARDDWNNEAAEEE